MDLESEAVDNPDAFHVYADSCLVCNQQCYLRPSYPSDNNSRLAESERERIVEIRGIIYQAFDIQVGKDFLDENRSELPLCPKCTFKLGQLRHVHFQLAALQREYNKLREDIAFSIVDLVAGSEGSKSYLADIGSKSPNSFLQCMKESEVDTIQHLVFENWHERYSEDDLAEESKLEIELPNLKTAETKQAPVQKPSTSQNAGGKIKQEAAAPSIVDSQTVIKSKSVPPPSSASTSIKAIASNSASNSGTTLKSDITPNTKVISITTATDTTKASVEVSSEDQEVNAINGRRARTDGHADSGQDDGNMIIAMSPTQFCGTSECSSPDPSSFLQEIDNSENEMDAGDEEDVLPFKLRQFEKIKVEQSGAQYSKSLKFPNDLEITEWSSDESQQRGLDYDIFDNDDGSQDLEGMLDESGNRIRNREGDVTVDNNSLGNIEFQQNEEGLYVCMFCSKTFIHKYPYRDHLKTHTGEGPRCPLCNKIFPKNHNLMLHMRTHTGEKPYKCLVCGKGFADKSNLKVHMRVHTGERPYKCEYCDQAFVNSSRLVVHRRLHTGEKPFVCDLCNRCFGTGNQLATHRKIHYEEKMFKCDECGKGYNSAVTLQAHVSLAH